MILFSQVGRWLQENRTPGRKVNFKSLIVGVLFFDYITFPFGVVCCAIKNYLLLNRPNHTHWFSFFLQFCTKVKEEDNRGSNFYLALYWAEELAKKDASWQVHSRL